MAMRGLPVAMSAEDSRCICTIRDDLFRLDSLHRTFITVPDGIVIGSPDLCQYFFGRAGIMARVKTEAQRQTILDAASAIFREKGYGETTMSEVAAQLGGSKGTLYRYFSCKEDLFLAVITRDNRGEISRTLEVFGADRSLRDTLLRFGSEYLTFILSPASIARRRLIIDAARRSTIGRELFENGPRQGWEHIAAYMKDQIAAGRLRAIDAWTMTRHLSGLLESQQFILRLEGVLAGPLTEPEIEAEVEAAVDVFLRAYGREATESPRASGHDVP